MIRATVPPLTRAQLGRGRFVLARLCRPLPLLSALLLQWVNSEPASAEEQPSASAVSPDASTQGGASALLFAGPSPGTPSAAKTATVATFYSLAGAGLASAGLFTYWYLDARAAEERVSPAGACVVLTSDRCSTLLDARHERRNHAAWAGLSGGASVTFLLAGLLTAHYWENTQATAVVSSDEAIVQWQMRF